MKQIEALVFDYGGVIVNIDDVAVVKAMESLGVTAFKRLIHVRKINDTLWQKSVSQMKQLGYSTDELFDEVFLSYAMRKEKPSIEIYEEMTQQTGLNPATTLYFDNSSENAEAAKTSDSRVYW